MTPETLNKLNDEELRAVINSSQVLLTQRDQERKENATAQARALLESVGLSFKAVAGKPSRRPVSYKAGSPYRHPTKPELTWNGKGQKPNWLRELEKQGGKVVEVTEPVNAAARKAS